MPDSRYVTRLSETALLLAGSFGASPGASVVSGQGGVRLDTLHFHSATAASGNGRPTEVLFVPVSEEDIGDGALAVETSGDPIELTADALASMAVDPKAFARLVLAPLDAQERERAMNFLASTLGGVPEAERHELAERLFTIREALRERLPLSIVSRGRRRGVHVDRMLAVDERSFYVLGWLHVPDVVRLTAVSPEGARSELSGAHVPIPATGRGGVLLARRRPAGGGAGVHLLLRARRAERARRRLAARDRGRATAPRGNCTSER